jgi:hypothetical protein
MHGTKHEPLAVHPALDTGNGFSMNIRDFISNKFALISIHSTLTTFANLCKLVQEWILQEWIIKFFMLCCICTWF